MTTKGLSKEGTPFTIGITGCNYSDGWGDLSHMFSVASTIKQEFPTCQTVFELGWSKSKEEIEKQRLQMLIDKLIYHHFLPKRSENHPYDGQTSDQLVEQINAANPTKFHMFTGFGYEAFLKETGGKGTQLKKVDQWICASTPISLEGYNDKPIENLVFPNEELHFFAEHGDPERADNLHRASKVPIENIHVMGWGRVRNEILADPIEFGCQGLFFEPTSTDPATALSEIVNPQFNQFLHGKEQPLQKKEADELLQHVTFIPTYFLRGENIKGLDLVIKACAQYYPTSEKTQEVFITGNYNEKEISTVLSEDNLSSLKKSGFEEIEIFDANTRKSQKFSLTQTTNENPKKLKILSRCYLTEHDYERSRKLATDFIGCCGDNTFQDAFIQKSLPLFFPHHRGKAAVLTNLAMELEKLPRAKNWTHCIAYLKNYQVYNPVYSESPNETTEESLVNETTGESPNETTQESLVNETTEESLGEDLEDIDKLVNNLSKSFTPELLSQWKEMSEYVIQNYNIRNILIDIIKSQLKLRSAHQRVEFTPHFQIKIEENKERKETRETLTHQPKIKETAISKYIDSLQKSGKLEGGFALSKAQREIILQEFSGSRGKIKIKKGTRLSNEEELARSVIRDRNNQLYILLGKGEIHQGKQATVKVAQNLSTGEFCLVKITKIKPGANSEKQRIGAENEENITRQIGHSVGSQYRLSLDVDKHYNFIHALPGVPLNDKTLINAIKNSENLKAQLALKLLLKLQELHQEHIIHRDIFPENILVNLLDNGEMEVNIIDVGSAVYTNEQGFYEGYLPVADDPAQKQQAKQANGRDVRFCISNIFQQGDYYQKDIMEIMDNLVTEEWNDDIDSAQDCTVDLNVTIKNVKDVYDALLTKEKEQVKSLIKYINRKR